MSADLAGCASAEPSNPRMCQI